MEQQSVKVEGMPGEASGGSGVPADVGRRFIRVEDKYYFADRTLAFRDRGGKLETESNNIEVVRSLMTIAEARHWGALRVTGSEDFRRAVWREASMRGIELSGYRPTAVEQAEVHRMREKRKPLAAELSARAAAIRDPEQHAELTARYPELAGVARALRASERLLSRIENDADRDRVTALFRETLARAIERGEEVRMRWKTTTLRASPARERDADVPVRG